MSKRRSTPPTPAGPESLTYEQAVAELESIIDRMESGETPLEDALADYERGVGLLRRCREIIAAAEQKIEHLKLSDAGVSPGGSDSESIEEDESTR